MKKSFSLQSIFGPYLYAYRAHIRIWFYIFSKGQKSGSEKIETIKLLLVLLVIFSEIRGFKRRHFWFSLLFTCFDLLK